MICECSILTPSALLLFKLIFKNLRVYQVDCSSIIEHAKVIVSDNGLDNGM